MPDEIWVTRDGTKIEVGKMTETHAKNALRMLLRSKRKREAKRGEAPELSLGEVQDLLDAQARDHTGAVWVPNGGYWFKP